MIRAGLLVFMVALSVGVGAASAQDIFLKYKKDESAPADLKPSVYIKPVPLASQSAAASLQVAPEIRLQNKALQKQLSQKIGFYNQMNKSGRTPKTAEEVKAYAEGSRANVEALNYKRREVMYADLAKQQQQMQKVLVAMESKTAQSVPPAAPPIPKIISDASAGNDALPEQSSKPAAPAQSSKPVYNKPSSGFKKPSKTF